jgi:SagB-type dehydrogenase family enzyme
MSRHLAAALAVALLAPSLPLAAEVEAVALPAARREGPVSLEAALAARRSVRDYAPGALGLKDVAQLLWAAQGVTSPDGKRTAPSAMHRYPLELVVVARDVQGLAPGAYRYLPARHALEPLATAAAVEPLLASVSPQAQVRTAPALFVVAVVYARMGSSPRDRAYADMEVGLASENLLLQATALGLGSVVTAGIDAAAAKKAAGLAGDEEVRVVIPVGKLPR